MSDEILREAEERTEKFAQELKILCLQKNVVRMVAEFKLGIEDHSETHPILFKYNKECGSEVQMVRVKKL